jgi:toxin secretion/phage lysis holin
MQKIKGGISHERILEHVTTYFCRCRRLAWLLSLAAATACSIALLIFVICDYITGVMGAISDKKLSSAVGFRGICRKVLIFILVGIANVIDINVLGQVGVLRTAVIFFYISNEGLSLIENAAHLGLPIPGKLKEVLEQLHNRDEKDTDKEEK